jgi:hypothetical protein
MIPQADPFNPWTQALQLPESQQQECSATRSPMTTTIITATTAEADTIALVPMDTVDTAAAATIAIIDPRGSFRIAKSLL